MELNNFTPAQTLMITRPLGVAGTDLMKYSFLDLVYRGILNVYKDWRLPHPRDTRERLYTFVSRGKLYTSHSGSFHQDPFVQPFKDHDCEYQVRVLAKKVYKESGNASGFKSTRVYKQLRTEGFFTTSLGLKYLNFFFLNGNGSKLRRKFKSVLKEADESLPRYADSDKEKAKNILTTLGSNVLLLECFKDELIERLKPLFSEFGDDHNRFPKSPMEGYGDMFEILFYAFLDTMDYFDSSFDSFDSSFDFGSSDFGGDIGGGDFGGGDFGGGDF